MTKILSVVGLTLVVLGLCSGSVRAQDLDESRGREIVISHPGVYVLEHNIVVRSGDAIAINASNVVLDLAGYSIVTKSPATGRGIVVTNARAVTIKNGTVGPFNMDVQVLNSENVTVQDLKIIGNNLPPSGGPVEMGIVFYDTHGSRILDNNITSVNLGVFIRGGGSYGNRVASNNIAGGPVAANNILAMCWNPLPGGDGTKSAQVPKGELAYANHISAFTDGISFATGSKGNVIKENVIQYYGHDFRPGTLVAGNNILDGNLTIMLTP